MKLVAPADDPRAVAGILRAKAWGGLAGFAVAGLGACVHGEPLFAAGLRALGGGVAGYVLGWAVAVAAWRRILRAEVQKVLDARRGR